MSISALDPTIEETAISAEAAPRLKSLEGATVGFISNGKEGTHTFFAHLDRLLRERCKVGEVVLRVKANYSAPAEVQIVDEIKNWDAVITGIGD